MEKTDQNSLDIPKNNGLFGEFLDNTIYSPSWYKSLLSQDRKIDDSAYSSEEYNLFKKIIEENKVDTQAKMIELLEKEDPPRKYLQSQISNKFNKYNIRRIDGVYRMNGGISVNLADNYTEVLNKCVNRLQKSLDDNNAELKKLAQEIFQDIETTDLKPKRISAKKALQITLGQYCKEISKCYKIKAEEFHFLNMAPAEKSCLYILRVATRVGDEMALCSMLDSEFVDKIFSLLPGYGSVVILCEKEDDINLINTNLHIFKSYSDEA